MKSAIFLDRDGVINAMHYDPEHGLIDSPGNPDQFKILPGTVDAIRAINESGMLAIVVSNQPGIAKGKYTPVILEQIDLRMGRELSAAGAHLDGVFYCLHHPSALSDAYRVACDCRKPKPGLLLQAASLFGIELSDSYMIGDGLTDVRAGRAAGCRTVLLGPEKCYVCRAMDEQDARPDLLAADLAHAVRLILGK